MVESNVPKHICIVMDGNGRWAKTKGMSRILGHNQGVKTAINIVHECLDLGIEIVTLYAFSTENWSRPKTEVDALFRLIGEFFRTEVDKLNKLGVKVVAIGDIEGLPKSIRETIRDGMNLTKDNDKITVLVALNYGGRWDITCALKQVVQKIDDNGLNLEVIDEKVISSNLSTNDYPDPDLFIRTGGERRLSNFMLWQLAYTELYFTDVLWPDFDGNHLFAAIKYYEDRDRRYGGIKEGENS